MDVKKRLLRRPIRTLLWQIMLIAMSLLLGVGGVLLQSAQGLRAVLDERQTTAAVQLMHEEKVGSTEWVTYPAELLQSDLDAIAALDMVKGIDLRTLTGAYIPELSAQIGLTDRSGLSQTNVDEMSSWGANGSYNKIIVAGTVEQAWMATHDSAYTFDLSALGGPALAEGYTCRAVVNIDRVISAHEDYVFSADERYSQYTGKLIVSLPVYYAEGDEHFGKNFFEVGASYVLYGEYEPQPAKYDGDLENAPFCPRLTLTKTPLAMSQYCFAEDGQLALYSECDSKRNNPFSDAETEVIASVGGERTVVAERVKTTLDDLLSAEHWSKTVERCDKTLHSFPVLGTEALESMYVFLTGAATIVEGRTLNADEYASGAKVCVISESVAKRAGVTVGDTLTFHQFHVPATYSDGNATTEVRSGTLNNPAIGFLPVAETEPDEPFTVVGVYRLANEWEDSAFSITPNTVFIPQKAQLSGGFGGASYVHEVIRKSYQLSGDGEWTEVTGPVEETVTNGVLGVYMSVLLENGSMEAFSEAIAETPYADRQFLTFDQGYESAKAGVESLTAMARKLFGYALLGWVLLLAIYLLLGQTPERKNLGIMRSVGAKSGQVRRYLFFGGLIPAAVGVAVGTLLSTTAARLIQDKLLTLAQSGEALLEHDEWTNLLAQSAVSPADLLLLALLQLGVLTAALWLHAAYLAHKKPGKLMGV